MDGHEVNIRMKDLLKKFKKGDSEVVALERLSLNVNQGEFVCLLGPSGCGKTTILRIVAGLEARTGGHVIVDGEEVTGAGDLLAVHDHMAAGPGLKTRDYAKDGGLAASGRTQETHELSLIDVEGEPFKGDNLAITLLELLQEVLHAYVHFMPIHEYNLLST